MKQAAVFTALVLLAVLAACGGPAPAPTGAASPPSNATETYVPTNAQGIRTVTTHLQDISDYLGVPARIEPDPTRVVHVFPPVGGRIVTVLVRPWTRVRQGQTLALLESSEVTRARADYQKARADAEVKDKALDRAADLFAHHAIAEKDYQQAHADAEMSRAELASTLERLRNLGADPNATTDQFPVPAPRSGVVLDIGAAPGEWSKSLDSPQPLCTVANLDSVWVVGEVFEKDVAGLEAGTPAQVLVNAYPDEKWSGRVAVVSDAVDPVTRTLKVRVVLPNPHLRLKPEMFASLRILRGSSKGVVLPAAAVVREGAASYVYVQTGSLRFERRTVTLGRTLEEGVEVTAGVKPGDVVVSEGALLLRAGT